MSTQHNSFVSTQHNRYCVFEHSVSNSEQMPERAVRLLVVLFDSFPVVYQGLIIKLTAQVQRTEVDAIMWIK